MVNYRQTLGGLDSVGDYQDVVDAIQTILCSASELSQNDLEAVQEQYVAAVQNVNERLRICERLLGKGLRTEMIQRCEANPNLLDLVTILDFPEQDAWRDYALECNLPPAPELLVDIAGELNHAYAAAEPLADLMYQHRVHALARSPLRVRLSIMHRLAQKDAENPIWAEDLPAFEMARLREIVSECQKAAQENKTGNLAEIQKELMASYWVKRPPKHLLKQVANVLSRFQQKDAYAELVALEPQLNEAYAANDVDGARNLRSEWESLAPLARLANDDQLVDLVQPVFQWLDDQERLEQERAAYESAVAALERALDRRASREQLESLYHDILRWERGVPEHLEQRLNQHLEKMDAQIARRRRTIWAVSITAVALIVTVVVFAMWKFQQSTQLAKHVTNLTNMIEEKKLDKAQEYLTRLEQQSPEHFSTPEIQQLKSELDTKLAKEEERQALFEQTLATARKLGLEEPSVEKPQIDNFSRALELARKAKEEIAVTDVERLKAQEVFGRIQDRQHQLQEQIDTQFKAEIDALQKQVDQLDSESTDYLESLQHLQSVVLELKSRPNVSANVQKASVNRFERQLEQKVEREKRLQREQQFLAAITQALGNSTQFRAKLQAYLDQPSFSDTVRFADFQTVLKSDAAFWPDFEAWDRFVEKWSGRNLLNLPPDQTTSFFSEASTLLKEHKGFPLEKKLEEVMPYLKSVADRQQGNLTRDLEDSLRRTIVKDVFFVRNTSTKRSDGHFYCLKPPTKVGLTQWRFEYLLDTKAKSSKLKVLKPREIGNQKSNKTDFDWTSPQARFSEYALEKIATVNNHGWETTFLDILGRLYSEKVMDPFLQLLLMLEVQDTAGRGSTLLKSALDKNQQALIKSLAALDENCNWVDPYDGDAMKTRGIAASVLIHLEGFDQITANVTDKLNRIKEIRWEPRYRWTGWLHRNRRNEWTCSFRSQARSERARSVFVLRESQLNEKALVFIDVGELEAGVLKPNVRRTSELVEGRPVFELSTEP